jgi:hypothetical protein
VEPRLKTVWVLSDSVLDLACRALSHIVLGSTSVVGYVRWSCFLQLFVFDDEFSVGKSELLDRPVVGLPVYQIELGFSPSIVLCDALDDGRAQGCLVLGLPSHSSWKTQISQSPLS